MGNKRLAAQTGHVTHLSSQLEETRREIEKLMKEKEELQGDRDVLKAQVLCDSNTYSTVLHTVQG